MAGWWAMAMPVRLPGTPWGSPGPLPSGLGRRHLATRRQDVQAAVANNDDCPAQNDEEREAGRKQGTKSWCAATTAKGRADDHITNATRGSDVRWPPQDRGGGTHRRCLPAAKRTGLQGQFKLRALHRFELEVDRCRRERQDLGMVMHGGRPPRRAAPGPSGGPATASFVWPHGYARSSRRSPARDSRRPTAASRCAHRGTVRPWRH